MQFASYFLQTVQGIRSTLIYRPGAGWPVTAPGAHSMATCRGGTRKWPWLRMHVLYRNGCRCYRCGQLGDEITLQICSVQTADGRAESLVALCARCETGRDKDPRIQALPYYL
jgi:hypothetical protein